MLVTTVELVSEEDNPNFTGVGNVTSSEYFWTNVCCNVLCIHSEPVEDENSKSDENVVENVPVVETAEVEIQSEPQKESPLKTRPENLFAPDIPKVVSKDNPKKSPPVKRTTRSQNQESDATAKTKVTPKKQKKGKVGKRTDKPKTRTRSESENDEDVGSAKRHDWSVSHYFLSHSRSNMMFKNIAEHDLYATKIYLQTFLN